MIIDICVCLYMYTNKPALLLDLAKKNKAFQKKADLIKF